MRRFFLVILAALITITYSVAPGHAQPELTLGVLAKRGSSKALEQWGPMCEYLGQRLNRPFKIVALDFKEVEPALKQKQIDFLVANSAFYARLEQKYQLRALATMLNRKGMNAMTTFGGVIFTRSDSRINDLGDIRGKKFMCVEYNSFGGAQMAWRLLLENGIDPQKHCAAFLEGGTHDNVVMAVRNGTVDVGTVRSDTLERMQEEGKIQLSEFKVINPIKDSFPYLHSTQLYPEWPFAAAAQVDDESCKKVAVALKVLKADHPAMKAAKVYSWTYPAKYGEVAECLRIIGAMSRD